MLQYSPQEKTTIKQATIRKALIFIYFFISRNFFYTQKDDSV